MPEATTPGGPALPPVARRTDFVADGLRFSLQHRGDPAFRFLRLFLRAGERDLDEIIGKIWCDAHPAVYGRRESLAASCLKSLLHPLYFLARKTVLWRREAPVDYDVETFDEAYFERWYRPIHDRLPGRKRVTPSTRTAMTRADAAEPVDSTITPRAALLLFAAPLFLPWLWLLSRATGRNLVAPYRLALGTYAVFEGHFRRYPTRHYLAYADDHNHPCRHLAFRQNCAGRMAVVQNGERTHHPVYAFGAMDDYLVFGPYMRRLAEDMRLRCGRVVPVGALYLNSRLALLQASSPAARDIDLLFVDQLVWPHNDFDEKTGRSLEVLFGFLNELKKKRPERRIVYQLRHYRDEALKKIVLDTVKRHFTEPIEIAENTGSGESYFNISRSRLVVTLNSTLGYEAFFVGTGSKVLFANAAGNPYEIYCDDPRFQFYDDSGRFSNFERHVEFLLELKLDAPPPAALERHAFLDNRVQERIAELMTGEDYQWRPKDETLPA